MTEIPDLHGWLRAADDWHDPYVRYAALRGESPVWHVPEFDEFLLFGHAEVMEVLRDPRFSSNPVHRSWKAPDGEADFRTQSSEIGAKVLLFLDPPDHTRLRRLVSAAFTPRRVEQLRARVEVIVGELLDAAAERGSMDVIADLGYPLPVTVICELMGVPVEDQAQFGPWSSDATRLLDGDIDEATQMQGMLASMQLLNYFNFLFDERRRSPQDDLVSALLAAEEEGDKLSEEELRSIVLLLFLAGHETTMNLIGNGMYALLRHPGEIERLRSGSVAPATAVEELLRFDSPVHGTARIATVDGLSVGGHPVEKGQQVVCLTSAANRDPEVFGPTAAVLDVGRDPNPHVSFSHGMHFCLGAALARMEAQVAIPALVRRFPGLALTGEPEYRDHFILRGLRSLPVTLA